MEMPMTEQFITEDELNEAFASRGSGVDGVAVVSAIFAAEDPGKATADLLKLAEEVVASNG